MISILNMFKSATTRLFDAIENKDAATALDIIKSGDADYNHVITINDWTNIGDMYSKHTPLTLSISHGLDDVAIAIIINYKLCYYIVIIFIIVIVII